MRKYDIKNKRNIGIIIVISVIIIVMFSLVISLFLRTDRKEYEVLSSTLVFDKDKTIIKIDDSGIIKTKWNNDYYLVYNDDNYELGDTAIAYNEETGVIYLYGRYYEISSGDEIKVTSDETVINSSALTKFYKLSDRKYLVIDSEIKSSDGLLSTTDFLMVDLDKVGNATLTNHKVSLKTFSETTIVTSNYTFDIANEILTYGSDKIDLKKIIGSTNTYTKEDLVPEENTGTGNGITDVTDNIGNGDGSLNGNGTGGGTGDSSESNGNTVLEEIKKASKNTSIISASSSVNKINIDYVIYDPYNEYISVYMDVRREGTNDIETIRLNKNDTNYVISENILPNTNYEIKFKAIYTDLETEEEITEIIDEINITTKLPNVSIKVTSTSFNKITYQINADNSYNITSGLLTVYVNNEKTAFYIYNGNDYEETDNYVVTIKGNTVRDVIISDIKNDDIIELRLTDIKSNGTIIKDLSARYMFKY